MVASPPGVAAGQFVVPSRLTVLSCPPSLCPHLEFALAAEFEQPVGLRWSAQDAAPGTLAATVDLPVSPGIAGRLVTRLRTLGPVAFEVTEAAGPLADAERFSSSPQLGVFRATLSANGDVVVSEGQLRALVDASHDVGGAAALIHGVDMLLGAPWDEQFEPLRRGGAEAPVSWLRRTG